MRVLRHGPRGTAVLVTVIAASTTALASCANVASPSVAHPAATTESTHSPAPRLVSQQASGSQTPAPSSTSPTATHRPPAARTTPPSTRRVPTSPPAPRTTARSARVSTPTPTSAKATTPTPRTSSPRTTPTEGHIPVVLLYVTGTSSAATPWVRITRKSAVIYYNYFCDLTRKGLFVASPQRSGDPDFNARNLFLINDFWYTRSGGIQISSAGTYRLMISTDCRWAVTVKS